MNRGWKLILIAGLLLFICWNLVFTQEISERREIAIFKLSYYDWSIPNEVLGSIDSELRAVFVNLGRFNVMAMTYRLDTQNVNEFIRKIKDFKEQKVEIPEEVAMGHEIFTEKDLNELISSFIVIIPSVTYFNVEVEKDKDGKFKGYKAEMKTSFSILNVDTMLLEKEIMIETSGFDEEREAAIQEAVENITSNLEFEIKSVSIFTLKTGVLDVYPGGVTLQMGKDMGIKKGFEFVILQEQVLKSGHKRESETGLLIVNKVDEEVSEATILYGLPQEGDQLKEIPRMGAEVQVYAHIIGAFVNEIVDLSTLVVGLRGTWAMNLYSVRPFLSVEVPFSLGERSEQLASAALWFWGIPFNICLGVEYTKYLGRLQISPAAGLGVGGVYFWNQQDPPVGLTHIGGKVYVSISYLITRDFKIAIDAGYALWISPPDSSLVDTYHGPMAGGAIIWKL